MHGFVGLAFVRNNILASHFGILKKLEDEKTQTWKTHEGMKQVVSRILS